MSDDRSPAARRPSGPGGPLGRLAFLGFARDPLGFVARLARAHPGAARLTMPGAQLVYLLEPEAIGEVLLDRERIFTKDWTTRALDAVLGQGLFTSEGDFWRRQRGLVAPPLHRKQIGNYVEIVARQTERWLGGLWDGGTFELKTEMTRLTMEIVSEALFGAAMGDAAARVAAAVDEALRAFETLIYSWRRFVPDHWEQPVRRRVHAASRTLDEVVGEIIRRKRPTAARDGDLLARLILAVDEAGAGMTDQQLRDEVVTMLLAGHETTAMALSFAFWFLARHPAAAVRLRAEAERVLGPGPPDAEQVSALVEAAAAWKETLRLRPPVWLFGREPQRDCVVGGWQLEKGTQVLITPWLMHHEPRWFPRPTEFLPERWLDGLEERLPRHVYLPFGGGQRVCAGVHFASMEGTLVLALAARALSFELVERDEPELSPAMTLRARGPLRLRVRRHRPAAS